MLDMQSYVEQLQRQFVQIHSAVNNTYVSYPADSVLGT
jgi:hypothetical protein